jgi:SAM-dependent methyltransferase
MVPRRATESFFDEAYYRLLAPFHPEPETRAEVGAIRDLLGLAQDDRVLDLGCGWGRHLRHLHAAGHQVVGLDLSPQLLRHALSAAPRRRGRSRPALRLVAADMRRVPFADASFDAVLNLASSLGLFLDDPPAVAALAEVRRVLRPGGRLLLEAMNRDDVVADYAARDAWTLDDGTVVRARRRLDAARSVSHEVLRWEGPGGTGRKRHSLRLRDADEHLALLSAAGLVPEAVYGGWGMQRPGRRSERLILMATVPGGSARS